MNEQVSKAGETLELASAENDGVEMKGNTFQIYEMINNNNKRLYGIAGGWTFRVIPDHQAKSW